MPTISNRFEALDTDDEQNPEKEKAKDKGEHQEHIAETSRQTGKKSHKSASLNNPAKTMQGQPHEMEIEYSQRNKKDSQEKEGSSQAPQNMEEDTEPLDIGELDILNLELACKTGNFEKNTGDTSGKPSRSPE